MTRQRWLGVGLLVWLAGGFVAVAAAIHLRDQLLRNLTVSAIALALATATAWLAARLVSKHPALATALAVALVGSGLLFTGLVCYRVFVEGYVPFG